MKRIVGFALLMILLSLLIPGNFNSTDINNLDDGSSTIINREKQEELIPEDFVVFFKTQEEYDQYRLTDNILSYPNLMAIKFLDRSVAFRNSLDLPTYNSAIYEGRFPLYREATNPVGSDFIFYYNQTNMMDPTAFDNEGLDGKNTLIGVIDNGINFNIEQLSHLYYAQQAFNEGYELGPMSHGTPVAGAIGGIWYKVDGMGFATGAKIVSAHMGGNDQYIAGDFFGAFDWILSFANMTVINTSWGGPSFYWDPIMERLDVLGVTLVGAIGNDGFNYQATDPFTSAGPGNHELAIGVGGIIAAEHLFGLTSEGPSRRYVMKPDIVAQAVDVTTVRPDGTYLIGIGTSFASPLVAGGIATLIQGLNEADISFTNGGLKAMLLEHARMPVNKTDGREELNDEYTIGRGILNFTSVYYDIINNGFNGVHMTPQEAPYGLRVNHIRNSVDKDILWLMSTHKSDLTISVTGNLTSVVSYTNQISSNNQFLPLEISSTFATPYGVYTGNVTVGSVAHTKITSSSITVTIDHDKKADVLFDLYHTDWDDFSQDVLEGGNTGEAIKILWDNGYHVVEYYKQPTPSVLADYDILWMPDPMSLSIFEPVYGPFVNFMTSEDIDTIAGFVGNGGSVFMDFLGPITEYGKFIPLSTHSLTLDKLLKRWNMYSYDPLPKELVNQVGIPWALWTTNATDSFTEGNNVPYWGSYIVNDDDSDLRTSILLHYPLEWPPGSENKLGMFSFDDTGNGGGRVIASSSNYWLDNCSLDVSNTCGEYYSGRENTELLLLESFNWLVESDILSVYNSNMQNGFSSSIYYTGGLDLEVTVYNDTFTTSKALVNNPANQYDFSFALDDGIYDLLITDGSRYLNKVVYQDGNPPDIYISHDNGSVINETTLIFNIEEKYMDKLSVIKDGFLLEDKEYVFNGTALSLSMSNIEEGSHYVNITIVDKVNQITKFNFEFIYALIIPSTTPTSDSPTNTTTTSDAPTTSTTSKEIFNTVSERADYLNGLLLIPLIVLIKRKRR